MVLLVQHTHPTNFDCCSHHIQKPGCWYQRKRVNDTNQYDQASRWNLRSLYFPSLSQPNSHLTGHLHLEDPPHMLRLMRMRHRIHQDSFRKLSVLQIPRQQAQSQTTISVRLTDLVGCEWSVIAMWCCSFHLFLEFENYNQQPHKLPDCLHNQKYPN